MAQKKPTPKKPTTLSRSPPPPEPEPEQNIVQAYPAATAATLTGVSALVVWILGMTDVAEPPPAVAAVIAGGLISIVLLVAKYGLAGLGHRIWRGKD